MSVLRTLEDKIAGLVEGSFGRVFRSEVRPIELAHKLVKEMDLNRASSASGTYVPSHYAVWLSPQDRERYRPIEQQLVAELSGYLLEHARTERLVLSRPPQIELCTDERLALGEFGIGLRPRDEDQRPVGNELPAQRVVLNVGGKRIVVPAAGATIGRSSDCEIVLADTGVSRRHAEIRPSDDGWTIRDLGSTNGLSVGGRPVGAVGAKIKVGDRLMIGTVAMNIERRW